MKRILIIAAAAALVAVSCEKKPETSREVFSVAETEATVPTDGNEGNPGSFTFTANARWTAYASADAKEWLTFSPTGGTAGKMTIKFTAAPYRSTSTGHNYNNRVGTITLVSGTSTKDLTVVQSQVNTLSLVSRSAEAHCDGGEVAIRLLTNIDDYSISIPAGVTWVTRAPGETPKVTPSRTYFERTALLLVEAFPDEGSRSVDIKIDAECLDAPLTFTLTQTDTEASDAAIDSER